jgi:hypothetical protein
MRVQVIDVEGTAEELASFQPLLDLISSVGQQRNGDTEETSGDGIETLSRLPSRIVRVLESRGPAAPARDAVYAFLTAVYEWGDVDIRVGRSRRNEDGLATMLRLHRRTFRRRGAFVYLGIRGANLRFRLPVSTNLEGHPYARTRNVQADDPYGVALRLDSPEVLSDAIRLARAAYDASADEDQTVTDS